MTKKRIFLLIIAFAIIATGTGLTYYYMLPKTPKNLSINTGTTTNYSIPEETLSSITDEADLIVSGKIKDILPGGPITYTDIANDGTITENEIVVSLNIDTVFKGTPYDDKQIGFVVPAMQQGDISTVGSVTKSSNDKKDTTYVFQAPFSFTKNDNVLLFLKSYPNMVNVDDPSDQYYGIVGFMQGIYNYDATTGLYVNEIADKYKLPNFNKIDKTKLKEQIDKRNSNAYDKTKDENNKEYQIGV